MNIFLKKVLVILLLLTTVFSCEEDDSSTSERENETTNSAGPIITENGDINLGAVKKANPNFKNENLRPNGAAAVDLLTDTTYKSLTLEIVSVKGFEPSILAKQTILGFIEERLNKPGGVKIIEKSIDAPGVDNYNVQTVFSKIEVQNRTQFSTDSDLAVFIFFADKDNEDSKIGEDMSSVILGTAYLNTSFVVYKETINKITKNNASDIQNIESATLNHEFCHLLGLVNSPTEMQEDHEAFEIDDEGNTVTDDSGMPKGNSHCDVEFCLMEANARLIRDMMGAGQLPILKLDPLCIKDLQAIGGK